MRNFKRIVALASVFTLATATNIFAATGAKTTPEVSFGEVALGIGVGLFVAYGMKAFRNRNKPKGPAMYDNGAKVPPMQTKKKKKKKKKK
ncbi:hypothetical protein [Peptoclostridium sp. AF21-18]|uniref:hypothetical protein n=1 Tax=Peptoclostridium sp. AF21-18 TaxID=2292243 RepID=UPI000E4BF55B|nr:hypothetical protein [Peptoclostridium sp. AF21-18]RHQ97495.1 hypothetical protein DWX74_07145 [Peptoclostridium sp. AF21-18]